jgi:hypothetical protein
MYDPGNIQADGDYCITISEESDVDDGVIVKVIDVSDGSPTVIPLTTNPSTAAELVEQVAVDGETATAVAVADDSFHIYDINAPTAAPTVVAVANGIGDTQIAVDGGYILFHDDQSPSEIGLVNIATRAVTGLTHAAAAKELALAGGSFGYFVDRDAGDSVGNFQRSAFGTVPGPGATLAADDAFIDGGTTNNGLLGWGESIAVTPDGARWFIGGKTSVGSGEYLQTGTGGAFEVVEDPSGLDAYGCKGTDVSVSSNTVAFKIGLNTDTTLGYIVLP